MKRILLITEDFNEMTFLETLLKKLGFDTVGIQNPSNALERAMELNPELVILGDEIKGKSTSTLVSALVGASPTVKVILIRSDITALSDHKQEQLDDAVKSPVDPVKLIERICKVGGLNDEQLLTKFFKLGLFVGSSNSQKNSIITVKGKIQPVSETRFIKRLQQVPQSEEKRTHRYEKAVSEIGQPKVTQIDQKVAVEEAREYRKRTMDTEIQKIDEQRKSFVRALFRK